ncbi:MAG: hypothetical protein KDB14_06650 [Planctomycetales bacterium]|nr:hypothetical protein [Planctomycetales bacterium]
MLKKLVYLGVAAAVLMGLFFGRDTVSYVGTFFHSVRDSVRQSIPIETEIARAREMITNLDKPIKDNVAVIAREEVEIERLVQEVDANKEHLTQARTDILRLTDDLRSGDATFTYNSKVYTVSQVKNDLAQRFDRFKTTEATTDNLQRLLDTRQKALDAARQKLESMITAKKDLEIKVRNLEARQRLVDAREATNEFASGFDDSALARTKNLVNEIQTRIQVAEKLVDSHGTYNFEIQLDSPEVPSDITSQITDYFGAGRDEVEALVSSPGK